MREATEQHQRRALLPIPAAVLPVAFLGATGLLTFGCQPRILAPTSADAMRAELIERTKERDSARARVAELETELARRAEPSLAGASPDGPLTEADLRELPEATPALAAVSISSLSTVKATGPGTGQLTLVVVPTDGMGRFLQIAGVLRASAAAIVPGREPMPAAAATFGPRTLRAAYRTGFMGTHYTLEIPLRWTGEVPPRAVSVAVDFTDGATRRSFPAAATLEVGPERKPPSR